VEEVLPLEEDLGPTPVLGKPLGVVKGRGPAGELPEVVVQLLQEGRILLGLPVGGLQLLQGGD